MYNGRFFLLCRRLTADTRLFVLPVVIVLAFAATLPTMAISKKKQKMLAIQQIKADVDSLIRLSEAPLPEPPAIIASDQNTYDYCYVAAWRNEASYTADTAQINAWYRRWQWVLDQRFDIPVEDWKYFPGYDPSRIDCLNVHVEQMFHETNPRYDILRKYCEAMRQQYREAQARTMPEGRLLELTYEERGSSRPVPVFYELRRDTVSGRITLRGYDFEIRQRDPVEMTVGEDVADSIRHLVEKHKVYQYLRYYSTPPEMPGAPPVCGGPPSWHFHCVFEGGTVKSASDGAVGGCAEIAFYLSSLLQSWEKEQNQR